MEENTNKKEKKIDIGLIVVILLIVLVLALIFLLVGQNTNLIYKKVKDDNMSIKVPFSYEVIEGNEAVEDENDGYIQYYYIHKDYGLEMEEMLTVLLKDPQYDGGVYSGVYSAQLDGYDAVQYNYFQLDHSPKISGFFYTAGLVTLVELENRFLVINVYNKIDLDKGKGMSLEDIQLDLYNKIMNKLKIHDNTMNMEEPEEIQIDFDGLEFSLPGYWQKFSGSRVNISYSCEEISYVSLKGHAIQENDNYETQGYIDIANSLYILESYDYIGAYKIQGEMFIVFTDNEERMIALSDNYWFVLYFAVDGEKYISQEKTQQAMIDMLFGSQK